MHNSDDSLKIKDYTYWSLHLHECQCYLGRVYLLAKTLTAEDFIEIKGPEREEFFELGKKIKTALETLFAPDKMNYAALSNVSPRLHVHFVPRYKEERFFREVKFVDERWGQNYAPYNKSFLLDPLIMDHLKHEIHNALIQTFDL
jgi:diadenosine tetraphosphate (Ap4A) HIT family hydrolase